MTFVRWKIQTLALAAALVASAGYLCAHSSETGQRVAERPGAVRRDADRRLIVHVDAGLLALPNAGPNGGGGILIPIGGTGAGLWDAGGVELGAEVRASRWIAVDACAGWYRPKLEVDRDRGPGAMLDGRSASVDLRTLTFALVITPSQWRTDRGRIAVGALLSRAEIPAVPSHLGLSVDDSARGVGVDLRGDVFLSENRRWGFGGALAFVDIDPSFVDTETGDTGSLQVSGIFLRLGARWAW